MTSEHYYSFDNVIIMPIVKAVNVASSPTMVCASDAAAMAWAVAKLCMIIFDKKVLWSLITYFICFNDLYCMYAI